MNQLFTVLLLLTSACANSQNLKEGYINDPDGYTNVRIGPNPDSEVVSTIKTGEIFSYTSDDSSWWPVKKVDGTKGFVHKSRIVDVISQSEDIRKLFNEIKSTNPNNVEFGEVSNEQLYKYAEEYPKSFVLAYQKSDSAVAKTINMELESPIHDLIPLKLVYTRIGELRLESKAQTEILESIRIAGNNLGINVIEE